MVIDRMTPNSEYIERLCMQLRKKIVSITALKPNNMGVLGFKPLAKWFLSSLKCSEEEFVLALTHLREHFPNEYYQISIPKKWDGCAHMEFPHLFFTENEVRLKANRSIPLMITEEGQDIGPFEENELFIVSDNIAAMLIRRRMAEKCDVQN